MLAIGAGVGHGDDDGDVEMSALMMDASEWLQLQGHALDPLALDPHACLPPTTATSADGSSDACIWSPVDVDDDVLGGIRAQDDYSFAFPHHHYPPTEGATTTMGLSGLTPTFVPPLQ